VGAHVTAPFLEQRHARVVAVASEAPLDIDGEPVGTGPIEVEVLPGALLLLA
jgi:diacylglycerol kinase family enzyme